MRPFFPYYGSKWRSVFKYPAPKYPMIIEPFAGSAGYSTRYAEHNVILVDKYDKIVQTWEYLINVEPDEILGLPLLETGQSLIDFDLTVDQKLFLGWWMSAASASPKYKKSSFVSTWRDSFRRRTAKQVKNIRHWGVFQLDYQEIPDVEATYFVDPPYQNMGRYYKHKNVDYSTLAEWCRSRKGQVIVCENAGADWLPFEPLYDILGASKNRRTEVFWCNS